MAKPQSEWKVIQREGEGGKLGNTWKLLSAYDAAPYSKILKHRYLMKCPNHGCNGGGVGTAAPIATSHAPRLYAFPAGIAPPPTEEAAVACTDGWM